MSSKNKCSHKNHFTRFSEKYGVTRWCRTCGAWSESQCEGESNWILPLINQGVPIDVDGYPE